MHTSIPVMMALLSSLGAISASAELNSKDSLSEQIREEEMTVERAPGKHDGREWLKLAILRQNAAQYRDSECAYRRAIVLLKSGDRARLADAMDYLGTMYTEWGRLSKAEALERKALAIRESQNDLRLTGVSHAHLSAVLLGEGKSSSAETEAEVAVSLLVPEQTHSVSRTVATPEEQMTALIDLSLARCARHACVTAVPEIKRALRIAHMNYTVNSIPVGFLDFLLGRALWKSGNSTPAEQLMRQGIQELSTQLGWGHPNFLRALREYRAFLIEAGHMSEAEEVTARIARLERSSWILRVRPANVPLALDQPH